MGVAVRPKKAKTPVRQPYDYELSDDENTKSSNKMKIVFKNVKGSKSKSKKDKSKYFYSILNLIHMIGTYLYNFTLPLDWERLNLKKLPNF